MVAIAYQNGGYIGLPEYDPSSKTIAINMAIAVQENGTGQIIGVLRTTINFNILVRSLISGLFGKTGSTNIYLPDGNMLRLAPSTGGSYELVQQEAPASFNALFQSTQKYQTILVNGVPTMASNASIMMPGNAGEDAEIIYFLKWRVVTLQDQSEALQPVTVQTRNIIFLAIAIILGVILAAFFMARVITGPIIRLNEVAGKLAAGDLTAEAKVETRDEIGTLAGTFNTMTAAVARLDRFSGKAGG